MTDPIIDRLDQIKGRADVATPGPWIKDSDDYGRVIAPDDPSGWDGYLIADVHHHDGGVFPQDHNAEFIAAARTDVEQMEAALRAVLDHLSQWQVPDPCEGPRDQWCLDCLCNDEIRQAIAVALGVETEGDEL